MNPNWSLLPHQPRLFFELPENATPKDLKRAYGRLIKQFKPDSHPAEFMRIRAAYEELERALAYGIDEAEVPRASSAPPPASSPAPAVPRPTTPPPVDRPLSLRRKPQIIPETGDPLPRAPNFAERLLALGRERRAELPESLVPQSAADYLHLAFFREALASDGAGEGALLKTLLGGAQKFPRDPGLAQALRHFFGDLGEQEKIVRYLEQARWSLQSGLYFYVTEGAWFRLAELAGGEIAAEKLQEITRDTPPSRGQMVFLARFLRRHFDSVDAKWAEECLLDLQEHGSAEIRGDFALLLALQEYVRLPAKVWEKYPALHEVKAIVQAVCRDETANHLARIYRVFRKLGDLETACQNFSGPNEDLLPIYPRA